MKKLVILCVALMLVLLFASCGKKEAKVEPQTAVEKVEEPTPQVARPVLSEEELFQQKSLEQLNKQGILAKINFDYDSYSIRDDMKPILEKNADWLTRFKTSMILIEGHCDERGTIEYNMALGEKRAEATRNYVAALGVTPERIKIVSYGKNKPLVKGVDDASFFQNRRAEFVIIKK